MREIKFRAWVDGTKTGTRLTDKEGNRFDKWMDYDIYLSPKGEALSVESGWDIQKIYNSIVMQYTGLKDCNGKDVYEGDIVICQQGCKHEMKYDMEIGGTYGGGMPGRYLDGMYKNNGNGYAWTGSEEVIGNIYENPELLK